MAGVSVRKDGVEFTYNDPAAGNISVAGSFNGWDTNANPLKKDENGVWKTVINLPEGSHSYKFVVDGNWVVDSDNPNTIDDGYGSTNSVIEVSSGNAPNTKKTEEIIKKPSMVNPKVFFDGRYYVMNEMIKGDLVRYSLEKPYHDLNLGVEVQLNDNMTSYTVMNINNTTEGVDMWKTHLNFKRTYLHLDAEYLKINAFDNAGEVEYNDPLQIIGGEGYYNYKFGYGYRGVYIVSDNSLIPYAKELPFNFKLELLGADKRGDEERDITSFRLQGDYDFQFSGNDHNLRLAGSSYSSRVNNTYNYTFPDTTSYSGQIVDSNPAWELDGVLTTKVDNPNWVNTMNYYLGYEHFSFENIKEFQDKEEYDFIVEDEHVWQDGSKDYLYLKIDFPAALKLKAAYEQNEVNLHYENFTDSIMVLPSSDIDDATFNRSKWILSADFEAGDISARLCIQRWENEFPDSIAYWNDYYRFMEKTDGNGRWYQEHSELSFAKYLLLGYDTGVLWNVMLKNKWWKLTGEYEANIAQCDLNTKPELIENFVRVKFDFNEYWQICTDTRIPIYNSNFLGLKTDFGDDEDVYRAKYTALKFHLNKHVWIALSYGINPSKLNDVTDEFYLGGRREYLEEAGELDDYLQLIYKNFGNKIRQAEDALSKDDRISLEAVIEF